MLRALQGWQLFVMVSTQGAAWVQSMMFGVTGSTLSDWLHFG